jgi:hypothetical protein
MHPCKRMGNLSLVACQPCPQDLTVRLPLGRGQPARTDIRYKRFLPRWSPARIGSVRLRRFDGNW